MSLTGNTVNVGASPGDGTGDPGRTAWQKYNAALQELYSNGSTSYVGPSGDTSGATDPGAINAAITALSAAGGGTLYLGAGVYYLATPVTLRSGVSITGVYINVSTGGAPQFLGQYWAPTAGTIIKAAGAGTQGFIGNATNVGSPNYNTWANSAISNIKLSNLCFQGFTGHALKVGAQGAAGFNFGALDNIWFYKCGSIAADKSYTGATFALELRNFKASNFRRLFFSSCANSACFYSANASDQPCNSQVEDIAMDTFDMSWIGITNAENYSRMLVVGTDPAFPSAPALNTFNFYHSTIQSDNRTLEINDTATFNGTSSIAITSDVSKFPVGMPVWFKSFSAGRGGFIEYQCYVVLTNSGGTSSGTITVGKSRGHGSAISSFPASGTATITQGGYPSMDLGGQNGDGLVNSVFRSLDCEGQASPNIYMEGCQNCGMDIRNVSQNTFGDGHLATILCLRSCAGGTIYSSANVHSDEDTVAGNYGWVGTRGKAIGGDYATTSGGSLLFPVRGPGFGFDTYLTRFGLSLGYIARLSHGQIVPDLYYNEAAGAFLKPSIPIGTVVYNATSAQTLNYGWGDCGGAWSLEQTSPQTYTLLAINDASATNTMVGIRYELVNTGSANAMIKPSSNTSGQYINRNSGLTNNQVLLTPGQWATFVSSIDHSGVTFWQVMTNGTIS